jgi:hypothetical protein
MGTTHMTYNANYGYDLGGNWMRERDTSAVGNDEGMFMYDPKHDLWTAVVLEGGGSTTVFTAAGHDPNHVAYHSVYPDSSMTDAFDRVSATKYTLHFTQTAGGKTIKSVDVCTKNGS